MDGKEATRKGDIIEMIDRKEKRDRKKKRGRRKEGLGKMGRNEVIRRDVGWKINVGGKRRRV